ncbi:MAG: TetR/AcrR family transcriptional regulator [Acutalibacteraceae bacterium]
MKPLRTVNEETRRAKKTEIMEKCFDCYAESGLTGVGIKAVAQACGCNVASLYQYFDNLDDLIIQSTEYCMSKVEDDFMAKAPAESKDVMRFIDEIPYWTAKKHGKKYRLMYQVYTHPKYIEHGKKFFEGVNERYTEYAKQLEPKIGIPYTVITPLIFILVRACVHYAMFEDEYYLKSQMEVLKQAVNLFADKYSSDYPNGGTTK